MPLRSATPFHTGAPGAPAGIVELVLDVVVGARVVVGALVVFDVDAVRLVEVDGDDVGLVVAACVGSARTTVVVTPTEGTEGTTVAGNTAVPTVVAVPLASVAVGPDDAPEPAIVVAGGAEVAEPSEAAAVDDAPDNGTAPGAVVVAAPDTTSPDATVVRADVESEPATTRSSPPRDATAKAVLAIAMVAATHAAASASARRRCLLSIAPSLACTAAATLSTGAASLGCRRAIVASVSRAMVSLPGTRETGTCETGTGEGGIGGIGELHSRGLATVMSVSRSSSGSGRRSRINAVVSLMRLTSSFNDGRSADRARGPK